MTELASASSPLLKARLAGVFYLLSVLTAVFNEFIVHGRLGFLGILIPISSYIAVTLLLYGIFRPVRKSLALLAVFFNLVGLAFEALQWQPRAMNLGMLFHGSFCLLIGYLILRSAFLPGILGTLMVFAGLVWLIYLSPPLAKYLLPYITAFGLLGEGLPMLWLLVMGVNLQRWKEQASGLN